MQNRLAFDSKGSGEVRIFFENERDLEFILERIEDLKFTSADNSEKKDMKFWDLLI